MLVTVAFHIQFLKTALVTAQIILVGKMKLIRSRSTPQDSVDAHAELSMPHPATLRAYLSRWINLCQDLSQTEGLDLLGGFYGKSFEELASNFCIYIRGGRMGLNGA